MGRSCQMMYDSMTVGAPLSTSIGQKRSKKNGFLPAHSAAAGVACRTHSDRLGHLKAEHSPNVGNGQSHSFKVHLVRQQTPTLQKVERCLNWRM